jgi:hypothetical protein
VADAYRASSSTAARKRSKQKEDMNERRRSDVFEECEQSSGNKETMITLEVPTSDGHATQRLFAPAAGRKSQPDSFQAAAQIKRSGETLEPLRSGIIDRSPD